MSQPELPKRALSDILEGGAILGARHILLLLRVTTTLILPVSVAFFAAFVWLASDSGSRHLAIGILVPAAVIYALTSVLAGAACVKAAYEASEGARPSARAAIGFAFGRLGPVLCLGTLLAVGAAPAIALPVVPGVTVLGNYAPLLLALAIFSLWFSGTFSVALPAMLVEQKGIADSLRRSAQLVRGSYWRALGTVVLGGILALFAGTIVAIVVSFFSYGGGNVTRIVTLVGLALGELFVAPLFAAFLVVLYRDLRARDKGSNVERAS